MGPTPAKYSTNNGTMKSPIPQSLGNENGGGDEMRPEVVMHEGLAFHLAWKSGPSTNLKQRFGYLPKKFN